MFAREKKAFKVKNTQNDKPKNETEQAKVQEAGNLRAFYKLDIIDN